MSINYDDISNIRYNSFTGEYTPIRITNEEHVIPSSAPYIITLNESPQRTIPSNINAVIKETSQQLLEKSKTTTPGINQYNVNYDELANGQIRVNAAQKGKTLQISYNGLGTIVQKSLLAFQVSGNASYVLAASDSIGTGRNTVDQIITVGQDAGAVINTYIDLLNLAGGGSILLLNGNYTIITSIQLKSNVKIIGSGVGTVLNKGGNISVIDLNTNSAEYCILNDFKIDGKKATYTGNGIYGSNKNTNKYNNIYVSDCENHGFYLTNCCNNCVSENNGVNGFDTVRLSSGLYSNSNGQDGFNILQQSSNCKSEFNTRYGFSSAARCSSLVSENNTSDGFNSPVILSSCISLSNGGHGFNGANILSNCQASLNSLNGFNNCDAMSLNLSVANVGSQYNNSFADHAGTQAVADTSIGGYNG